MTYGEFKMEVVNRNYGLYQDGYSRVISFVDEVYGEKNIKAFYAKNLFNELGNELYFVFEHGLLKITKQEGFDFVYDYIASKVINKKLITSRYPQSSHELTVTFDTGEQIIFHNKEDSDSDWVEEYSKSIIELYKIF